MSVHEEIFKAIFSNDMPRLRELFVGYNLNVNLLDDRGMTPIHYAAFKGSLEIVSWLVARGADVNCAKFPHKNSALHFAAVKGNAEVCRLLLECGAEKKILNNINRTASEIAIASGHYRCAVVINNYLPKEEVTRYATLKSTETTSKLSPALAEPVYSFVMMTNIHPVKVVFEIPSIFLVDDNASKIVEVLHLMSKREFSKEHDTKEMLSFKFHYLATILFEIAKPNDTKNKKVTDSKDVFIQKISKNKHFLEQFLYNCIVMFRFKDSTLFRKMVCYMSQGMDSMRALDIILLLIGNKRSYNVDSSKRLPICGACEDIDLTKICPKCKTVEYCNRKCLRIHSAMHKKECKEICKNNKALTSETSPLTKCLSKLGIK